MTCLVLSRPNIRGIHTADALAAFNAPSSSFTDASRRWVCRHAATSYDEIEQATLRLVALRTSGNLSLAAAQLRMTLVSLMQWIGCRKLPFAFDDANIRGGAKEWLARIRGGAVPWDNEAIAGQEAVLVDLEARRALAGAGIEQAEAMKALRVILCKVGDKPHLTWLDAAPGGGHTAALGILLGLPVARLPLLDGVDLCCDRDGLLFGLALVRRTLAMSTVVP